MEVGLSGGLDNEKEGAAGKTFNDLHGQDIIGKCPMRIIAKEFDIKTRSFG